MGKVFSPEQVAQGEVPEDGVHEAAARYLLEELFEPKRLVEHPPDRYHQSVFWTIDPVVDKEYHGIQSGLVYGSVAAGTSTRRSDIDLLVNYHANCAEDALPVIHRSINRTEQKFKTPVEANVYYVGALHSPLEHHVDPLFAAHLLAVQEQDDPRWSYNRPVELLSVASISEEGNRLRALAVRYMSYKAHRFAEALASTEPRPDLHVMQRALELPSAIGRKALAVFAENDEELRTDKLTKAETAKKVLDKLRSISWPDLEKAEDKFIRLWQLDEEYSAVLEAVISGEVNIETYRSWLAQRYEESCLLAHDTAYVWRGILRNRLDERDYDNEFPVLTHTDEGWTPY